MALWVFAGHFIWEKQNAVTSQILYLAEVVDYFHIGILY